MKLDMQNPICKGAEIMDWMKEWREKGLLESPAVKEAADRLERAQYAFIQLPEVLSQAGVDKKDNLTVEVFVEIITRLHDRSSSEIQFATAFLYEELTKLKNQ